MTLDEIYQSDLLKRRCFIRKSKKELQQIYIGCKTRLERKIYMFENVDDELKNVSLSEEDKNANDWEFIALPTKK